MLLFGNVRLTIPTESLIEDAIRLIVFLHAAKALTELILRLNDDVDFLAARLGLHLLFSSLSLSLCRPLDGLLFRFHHFLQFSIHA